MVGVNAMVGVKVIVGVRVAAAVKVDATSGVGENSGACVCAGVGDVGVTTCTTGKLLHANMLRTKTKAAKYFLFI